MGWMFNATPQPLYPWERPGTHCIGGWVGPRAGLDGCGKSRPPTGIRSPDRPARSQSLYWLGYPSPLPWIHTWIKDVWIFRVSSKTNQETHIERINENVTRSTRTGNCKTRFSERWSREMSHALRIVEDISSFQCDIWSSHSGQWFRASAVWRLEDWYVVTGASESLLYPSSGSELIRTVAGLLYLQKVRLYRQFHSTW